MSLTITTPGGTRKVDQAVTRRAETPYELRGELHEPTGGVTVYGDEGFRPEAIVVEVDLQEATLGDTAALAEDVRQDAEAATQIELPLGTRSVDGVLSIRERYVGPSIRLELAFAPTDESWS